MKVKICGITNCKDAQMVEKLGADIVGIVFAKSPRQVSISKAEKIIKKISPFTLKAGVFVNENYKKVNSIIKRLKLDIVQLHGDETPDYIKEIEGAKIIKAIRVKDRDFLFREIDKYYKYVDLFLFDTFDEKKVGGTGKKFDWKILHNINLKFFLAGGLTPDNIYSAIVKVKPYGVDISSGVEVKKGKKSKIKLKKLFLDINKAERKLLNKI